jgi:peptidoglycan-associated lipoprotein
MTKTAMTGSAAILALTLALGLGGCQTIRTARDRIVRAQPTCVDQVVPIYFQTGVAEVPADGRRVLQDAAQRTRGCTVKSVSVIGLADASGSPEANLELSRRRVQSVTAILTSMGLPAADFDGAAVGASGAVTPDGRADPLRRRAEVTLRLGPRT